MMMRLSKKKFKKTNYVFVYGLVTLLLITILTNQIIWINNMYGLFRLEFKAYANRTAQDAVLMEVTERTEILGGAVVYSNNITNPGDSSRFFSKKVVTEDSTYTFTIDKNDPATMPKIVQFVIKNDMPVNLDKLSHIFKTRISDRYKVQNTYFDYIDLTKNKLIKTNKPDDTSFTHYVTTDTIPLDIIHSIGVVGYIDTPNAAILNKMIYQLVLSVVLIVIGIGCLYYITRSFIFQWKEEKMRQDSVNAMTHEFKRPISNAVAMAALIPFYIEKNNTDKVIDYVNNIQLDLNRLTLYTKRIQQISNNEKGKAELAKIDVEIIPFFESLKQRYAETSDDNKKPAINLHIDTNRNTMYVDLLHFSNVMDNLTENAIKYTVHANIKIDITVSDTTDGIKISVKDNGIGISSAERKHIFDKFYRVKRAETKTQVGFGLGLTYVKSIVDAHEGVITVSSKMNEGSEFIVFLKG